jgi:signal transduction histidine kinase
MFLIVSFTLSSLRAAQNRREELAQFVVHDLRSPLSNILAGLNLLNETMTDGMDKQIVTLGIASSNRMLTLINSMLDLAKLESGKMTLAVQETSVQDLFDAAIHQVSALADQEQVRVISRIEGDAGLIRADADVTVRVLVNLLSNALKYSPADSEVVVSAAPYADNQIAVSVKDQGKGVPAQWANRVFDKFTQIEARKAGYAVGSGLGLSFCRLAVESQGGRIWLESEVNQGATVIFTLPRP